MTLERGAARFSPAHVLAAFRQRGHRIVLVPARFLLREALAALGDLKSETGLAGSLAVAGLILVAVLLKECVYEPRQSEERKIDDS